MPLNNTERFQLLFVLSLAAVLRMAFPGITEFKADEARLYTLAYDLVSGDKMPLHGIGSSIGVPNFALPVWLYALPMTLVKHPYAPTLFTGLLNTIAVYTSWRFTRHYWCNRTAIFVAFLYAVSPWAVIYSRKIWAQNLLPIFVIFWAITAVVTFTRGGKRPTLAHGLLMGCLPQIHFSGIVLLAISIAFALIYRRIIMWRWLVAGAAISLALATPSLFHLASHGFTPSPDTAITIPGPFSTNSLLFTWSISTGTDLQSLAGNPSYRNFLQMTPNLTAVHWLWGTLTGLGCWRILRTRQDPQKFVGRLLLVWLFSPALLLLWSPLPIYPHYFIITFPAQYITAGLGSMSLLEKTKNALLPVAGQTLLIASGALQVWGLLTLFQFISQHATPGGYGIPLAVKLAAAESTRTSISSTAATEVLLVGSGTDPAVHQFPAVYDALLRDIPRRFVNGTTTAVRTDAPVIVLLQNSLIQAQQRYIDWSNQVVSIHMRENEEPINVMELPVLTTEIAAEQTLVSPITLANGVKLLGFETTPSQHSLHWELHWRPGDAKLNNYHFFNHLLDQTGKQIGQIDLPAYASAQWVRGDRVISFFSVPYNEMPHYLRFGMYSYPDLEPIPLLDSTGAILDHSVTIKWYAP